MKTKSMNIFDELLESYGKIKQRRFKIVLSEQGMVTNTPEGLYQKSQSDPGGAFYTVPDGQPSPTKPRGVPTIRTSGNGNTSFDNGWVKSFSPGDDTWNNDYVPLFGGGGTQEEGGQAVEGQAPVLDLLTSTTMMQTETVSTFPETKKLRKIFEELGSGNILEGFIAGLGNSTYTYKIDSKGKLEKKLISEITQEEFADSLNFKRSILASLLDITEIHQRIGDTDEPVNDVDIITLKSILTTTGESPNKFFIKSPINPEYGMLLDTKARGALGDYLNTLANDIFEDKKLNTTDRILDNYKVEKSTSVNGIGVLAEHIISAVLSRNPAKLKKLLKDAVQGWDDTTNIVLDFQEMGFLEGDTDVIDKLLEAEGLLSLGNNKVEAFKNFARIITKAIGASVAGNLPESVKSVGVGQLPGRKEDLQFFYSDINVALGAAKALGLSENDILQVDGKFSILVSLKTYMTNGDTVAGNQTSNRANTYLNGTGKTPAQKVSEKQMKDEVTEILGISGDRMSSLETFAADHQEKMNSLNDLIMSSSYIDELGKKKSTKSQRISFFRTIKDEVMKNLDLPVAQANSLVKAMEADIAEAAASKKSKGDLFTLIRRRMDTQRLSRDMKSKDLRVQQTATDYIRFQAMSTAHQLGTQKSKDIAVIDIRPTEGKVTTYQNNALVQEIINNGKISMSANGANIALEDGRSVRVSYRGKDNRVEVHIYKNAYNETNSKTSLLNSNPTESLDVGDALLIESLSKIFKEEAIGTIIKNFL